MNNPRTLAFAAVFLFAGAVHAHDCTGGADGGMDATGNQCNAPIAFATAAPAAAAVGITEHGGEPAAVRTRRSAASAGAAPSTPPVRVAGQKSGSERFARATSGQGR